MVHPLVYVLGYVLCSFFLTAIVWTYNIKRATSRYDDTAYIWGLLTAFAWPVVVPSLIAWVIGRKIGELI